MIINNETSCCDKRMDYVDILNLFEKSDVPKTFDIAAYVSNDVRQVLPNSKDN